MVLFMLAAVPLVCLMSLVGLVRLDNLASTVRNPLLSGVLSFVAFLILGFVLGSHYPPDYRIGPSFAYFLGEAQLWPFAFGASVFALVHRRLLRGDRALVLAAARCYFAVFLGLLSLRDLIFSLNQLGTVELFYLPLARIAWFLVITWLLAEWRQTRRYAVAAGLSVLVLQVATAASLSLAWLTQPLAAALVLVLPLAMVLFVWLRPAGLAAALFGVRPS